jgi:hypothetical protein
MQERHVCDYKVTDDICGGLFLSRRDLRLNIGKFFSREKMAPILHQHE